MTSSTPNAIDKWRERVLFRESVLSTTQSWVKRLEKQIAVLRVALPFLTDSQIRGKAWNSCGFNSIMGAVPRTGLTPEAKKEFSKRKVSSPLKNMPRKSKTPRKLKRGKSVIDHLPTDLDPSNDVENNASPNDKEGNDFPESSYTPKSGINMLSDVSNEIAKRGTKRKRRNSSIIEKIKVTDTIVEETPDSTLGSGTKTFYCSQTLVGQRDPDIMQAVVPSLTRDAANYSQPDISLCTTNPTADDSKTASGLDVGRDDTQLTQSRDLFSQKNDAFLHNLMNLEHDGYVMSQLFDSQASLKEKDESTSAQIQENIMTQLYDSNSFMAQRQQSSSNMLQQNTPTAFVNNNLANNVKNQKCLLTQLYDSNSFKAQNQQSSSNILSQHSNAASNNLAQSPQGTGSTVMVAEDLSSSSLSGGNKQQSFNLGQTTPVRPTNIKEVRKRIAFATSMEMDHDELKVEDNYSGKSSNNQVSRQENPLSYGPATCGDISMIVHPPTKFNAKPFNADFLENSELTTPFIDTQKICDSFTSTPEEVDPLMLPPTLLLSNYCSEYDKAYTIKDLKPNQYRHYRQHEAMRSLKEHLDKLIPPDVSIKERYKITNLP